MKTKIKALIIGSLAAALVAVACVLYFIFGSNDDLMRLLLNPQQGVYLLAETTGQKFPDTLKLCLNAEYGLENKGNTPRGAIMDAARFAERSAFLYIMYNDSPLFFAAHRLNPEITKELKNGKAPEALFPDASVDKISDKIYRITSSVFISPVYYFVDRNDTAFSDSKDAITLIDKYRRDKSNNLSGKKWELKKEWKFHAEVCDGAVLTSKNGEALYPICAEFAWDTQDAYGNGNAVWSLEKSHKYIKAFLKSRMKSCKWDTEKYILPEPVNCAIGVNLPEPDSVKDIPFPLSVVAGYAKNIGYNDSAVKDLLSGQTALVIGSRFKLAWFSLPGFLLELTGNESSIRQLLSEIWEHSFSDILPVPLPGFEKGGVADDVIPAVAAANDGFAIAGMTSQETLLRSSTLDKLIPSGTDAIGWLTVDIKRMGALAYEITKFQSAINAINEDEDKFADDWTDLLSEESKKREKLFLSLRDALKGMGHTIVIWETPLEGKIEWYTSSAHAKNGTAKQTDTEDKEKTDK